MFRARLLRGLALLFVAACCFALTWLAMHRPWERTVPFREDPVAMAADRRLVQLGIRDLPAGTGEGPDIVLIVLDTVRADHLELYGYHRDTMPRLTEWARHAKVYDRALSTSSWTLPAHASLFTGQYPATHGARGSTVSEERLRRVTTGRGVVRLLERPLDDDAVTVAERLWDRGYTTLGFAANKAFLDKTWKLWQGFDLWLCDQPPKGRAHLPYTRADRITAMALEAVDSALPALDWPEQRGRAPLFLFVNYMEAHGPYVPRTGFVHDPASLLWTKYRTGRSRERLAWSVLAQKRELPDTVREGWIEAYDAELSFLDLQLSALLEGLEQRGIGEDALIIVVSDHGEYFGEHQLVAHSKDVYEGGLRIPLLVRGPGFEPGHSSELVQLHDVAGWIVSAASAEPLSNMDPTEGLAVSELYGSRSRDLRNRRFNKRFNRVRRAFHKGDRKVILGSDGSFEAYDLADDPEELRDLSDQPWAAELADEARSWMQARSVDDANAPDDEDCEGTEVEPSNLEALRALGYVD